MFNVIKELNIKKSDKGYMLEGVWLCKGELHNFTLQCQPMNVFKVLQKMKDSANENSNHS